MKFSNWLTTQRVNAGLSKGELARRAGTTPKHVGGLESGAVDPSYMRAKTILHLAEALHPVSACDVLNAIAGSHE